MNYLFQILGDQYIAEEWIKLILNMAMQEAYEHLWRDHWAAWHVIINNAIWCQKGIKNSELHKQN